MKKNNARLIWCARAALVLIVVAALVAWWRIPAVNAFIQHSLAAFSALDQHAIERFIHAYGPQAALVSFALMILQAVVAAGNGGIDFHGEPLPGKNAGVFVLAQTRPARG